MTKILVYGVSNEIGGIEAFFINILSNLKESPLLFDFITSSESSTQYDEIIREVSGTNFKVTPWGKNAISHKKEVKKLIENDEYDYIWVNSTSASNISIYKLAKRYSGSKLIIHSHGSAFETRNVGWKFYVLKFLHQLNKRFIRCYGDIFFASSKEAADWLFGSTKNVEIIKNGIDTERYLFDTSSRNRIREQLGITDKRVLINIGRLENVKNQVFLLELFSEILKHEDNIVLLIIGEGSLENMLREKIKEMNLDEQVFLLGFKNNIEDYLKASDLFVLPSKSEGLSIATIEAQATGLSCLVSENVPTEINITGKVSYLGLDYSMNEWSLKIINLLDQSNSRKEMEDIVKKSGFSIERTIEVIEKLLAKEVKINE
ncbi:glycosyltransferase [Desemzia incerta]|uniref:glycosyltransferase n=1 Tax=Desemzia incerta TaxID=82801 RepID=UPI0024C21140|nr:glycosyltransferase [Desemzia incerta]WHZ31948.1 glycosyltransferase [Desemzia incerta]